MRNAIRVVAALAALWLAGSAVSSATPPPASPGLSVGYTTYDLQHNQSMGRQVARQAGSNCVHFSWTAWDRFPLSIDDDDRYMAYTSFTITDDVYLGTLNQGFGGMFLGLSNESRAGFVDIAAGSGNLAQAAFHQRQDPVFPYRSWRIEYPVACLALHIDDELSSRGLSTKGILWPKMDIQERSAGADMTHEIARDADDSTGAPRRVYYWRNSSGVWQGPVLIDSNQTLGYVVTADDNSDKCAILMHTNREAQFSGAYNIACYESFTAGAGWLDYTELGDANKHIISNYTDPGGVQAWRHISAVYDNDGVLNVIWDERQDPLSTACIIRHWNQQRATIRPVTYGLWSNRRASTGGVDLSLAKMTIGVGDGGTTCDGQSNRNYLYVLYTRFGGPTAAEQADSAVSGFMNGELYLNVSTDGGSTWAPPTNLTNTKTPNCHPGFADTVSGVPTIPDSVCRSEHWASINKVVHDIDVLYISDIDAGSICNNEGTWQQNPVKWLRLVGGTDDALVICPANAPAMVATYQPPVADYCGVNSHATQTLHASLTFNNMGNAPLQGQVSVVYTNPPNPDAQWLALPGGQTSPFDLSSGSPELSMDVAMTAFGLARGSYQAELRVTHNDPSQPSPQVFAVTLNADPCACHSNPVCDSVTDILDVTAVINYAFRGAPKTSDPFCPSPIAAAVDGTTDVDCSGATDVIDVVNMINVAFRGGDSKTRFCDPCTQPGP